MDLIEPFKRAINKRTRMQPSFIILGAQKAGTTALFHMLSQHPDILPPRKKELDHFNVEEEYAKGMGHYLSNFPVRSIRRKMTTFEASPAYLFHASKVAPRLKKHLPKVTCVIILRDPVIRAYSAWNMFRDFKSGATPKIWHESRTFRQALDDELAGRPGYQYHQYLFGSHYAEQIACFQEHFPKDQLIIRSYLDLKRDPQKFVDDLCEELGYPPMPPLVKVTGKVHPYQEPLDPSLAAELYQYFAPELVKLRHTLGYDLYLLEDNGRSAKG